ncbi:MAG: hypothetical protein EXQ79_07380 [Acidimicrobiia bacterium]|nr:hypothetical protein [Acidimicrobiia bacterium]
MPHPHFQGMEPPRIPGRFNGAGCDYTKAALLHANPTGDGTLQLEIVEGQVGDGICDAKHKGCFILIDNESSSDPNDAVFITITFAK